MNRRDQEDEERARAAMSFDRLQQERAALRALHRCHVLSSIGMASPLAFDVTAAAGYHLPTLVAGLGPGVTIADDRHAGDPRGTYASLASMAYATGVPFTDVVSDYRFQVRHRRWGTVLRSPSHEAGALGVRLANDAVHVEMAVGRLALHVDGSCASLIGEMAVDVSDPASKGRPVDALIRHPLLLGRDYPVIGVVSLLAPLDTISRSRVMIVFETGCILLWT